MKKTGRRRYLSDRMLVLAFLTLDLVLFGFAYRHFSSLNELTVQSLGQPHAEADRESRLLEDLERIAQAGSWEDFEASRAERAALYLSGHTRPSSGVALYFFPETLPPQSLEKDFADFELKPGIAALRQAYDLRKKTDADKAYQVLETRVENYETGLSEEPNEMSDEAQTFLKTYHGFTSFPENSSRAPSSTRLSPNLMQ